MDYYIIVRSTIFGENTVFKRGKRWVKSPEIADQFECEAAYLYATYLNSLPHNPYFYTYELALPF